MAGAAALTPLALAVPAAHADQHFTGASSASDTASALPEIDGAGDRCLPPSGSGLRNLHDTVSFVSQSNGPRRFVTRDIGGGHDLVTIWVYRNGTCVAADFLPDNASENAAGIVDVDNVVFAVGDRVTVKVGAQSSWASWRVDVLQPGTADAAASGKAKRYVTLPYQVSCGTHRAVAKATKNARTVKSVVFKAGGTKVGAAHGLRPRQKIRLKGIPAAATSIKAVVRLKGGGKATVVRPYSHC
ncbi:hypothetical protein GCM10022237_11210 [Nocardioides ginsengisoli]